MTFYERRIASVSESRRPIRDWRCMPEVTYPAGNGSLMTPPLAERFAGDVDDTVGPRVDRGLGDRAAAGVSDEHTLSMVRSRPHASRFADRSLGSSLASGSVGKSVGYRPAAKP